LTGFIVSDILLFLISVFRLETAREFSCSAMFLLYVATVQCEKVAKHWHKSAGLLQQHFPNDSCRQPANSPLSSPSLMQRLASSCEGEIMTRLLQPIQQRVSYSSAPWCTSACIWLLQFICQKCVPVAASTGHQYRSTFSITWWLDCTTHQDVKVWTMQFCGLRSIHLEQSTTGYSPVDNTETISKQLKTFLCCLAYETWLSARSRDCL